MKIVVLTTDKEGISTSLVGDQTCQALTELGHEVVRVNTDGKAGTPVNVKEFSRNHVICLLEHKVPAILTQLRYSRPLSLTCVWTGNVEGYTNPDLFHYVSHFFNGKFGGVPIRHVSHSFHTHEKLRTFMGDYFKSAYVQDWSKWCEVVPYGIDPLFEPGTANDPDLLMVPMNRVAQGAKQVGVHAELTGKYHSVCAMKGLKPVSKFYYAPGFGPQDKKLNVDLSIYDFEQQPDWRVEYMANAKKAGMFFSVSQWESFGIYYLELLASGCVGVFLDKPWIRKLLPEYPYIVSKNEIVPAMVEIRANYKAERERLLEETVPHIREKYSLQGFARGLTLVIDKMEK